MASTCAFTRAAKGAPNNNAEYRTNLFASPNNVASVGKFMQLSTYLPFRVRIEGMWRRDLMRWTELCYVV